MKEQYNYLWWWLLNKGLILAALIINGFLLTVFGVTMTALYYFLSWYSNH